MGMNFNFNNNSMGWLFGGGSSGASGLSSVLGDYSSIKNGSYGKLLKAYYKENGSSSVSSTSSSTSTQKSGKSVAEKIIDEKIARSTRKESAESKAYTSVKKATDDLQSSIDKLAVKGDDSLYAQKLITTTDENGVESTEFGYDKEAIYKAVSSYVDNYNAVLKAAGSINNSSIANRVTNMQNDTKTNQQALNQLGITINADNTLAINKDNFMKADMKNVENLFADSGYTKSVANSADLIHYTANYEQVRADTYTSSGTFSNTTSGSSFSSSL